VWQEEKTEVKAKDWKVDDVRKLASTEVKVLQLMGMERRAMETTVEETVVRPLENVSTIALDRQSQCS
jgi:hypothetical protein